MSTESRLTLDSPNIRGYVRKHPLATAPAGDNTHEHRPPRSRLTYDRHKLKVTRRSSAAAGSHSAVSKHGLADTALSAIEPSANAYRQPAVEEFTLPVMTDLPVVPLEVLDLSTDIEEFPDDIPAKSTIAPKKLMGFAAGKARKLLSNAGRSIRKTVIAVTSKRPDPERGKSSGFWPRIWYERTLAMRICMIAIAISLISVGAVSYRSYQATNQMVSQVQTYIPDPELVGQYNVVNRNDTAVLAATAKNDPLAPSTTPISPEDIKAYQVEAGLPRVITIPSIGVRTIIKSVSRHDVQAAEGPSNVYEVNWFQEGARSTDLTGAMLLTGYYSGPNGDGAFSDLEKIQIGDIVQIENGNGMTHSFRVVESLFYDLGDTDMTKAVTSVDPTKLGLNLMTCDGDYDVATKIYEHRLLVRAVKI